MGKWYEREMRLCPMCPDGFIVKPGDKKRFCSRECQFASMRRELECGYCGKSYQIKNRRATTFCSRTCQGHAARRPPVAKAPLQQKACAHCTTLFTPTRTDKIYCSDDCSRHRPLERPCVVCAKRFLPENVGGRAHVTCSSGCRDSHRKATERPHKRKAKSRRRAMLRGVVHHAIDPRLVFERDHWTCQLCFSLVPQDVPTLHPLAATIDHIIPISKGGPHTFANMQMAHRRCNWQKGDKISAAA